jgi:hypothetical protein
MKELVFPVPWNTPLRTRIRREQTDKCARDFRSPLTRASRDLRLTKSFKVATVASKPPGIWRMSVHGLPTDYPFATLCCYR